MPATIVTLVTLCSLYILLHCCFIKVCHGRKELIVVKAKEKTSESINFGNEVVNCIFSICARLKLLIETAWCVQSVSEFAMHECTMNEPTIFETAVHIVHVGQTLVV